MSVYKTPTDCSDSICRADAMKLVKSYIHEIITESGIDKNEHTNKILTEIIGKLAVGIPPTEPKQNWIPLKTRPMTDEESTFYRDWAEYGVEMFDCPLPDDGQEVLVSCGGNVFIDVFVKDDSDGCYFEGVEIEDVDAWMPLPESYKKEQD